MASQPYRLRRALGLPDGDAAIALASEFPLLWHWPWHHGSCSGLGMATIALPSA